jgi:type IV secretory pathway VirB2 component (pilin)
VSFRKEYIKMDLKGSLKYITNPAKIITAVVLLVIGVHLLQGFVTSMAWQVGIFWLERDSAEPMVEEDEKELSKEELILSAERQFLPDGTIHLVRRPRNRNIYRNFGFRQLDPENNVKIYDKNTDLIWQGLEKDIPYEYFSWATYFDQQFPRSRFLEYRWIAGEFSRSLEVPIFSAEKVIEIWRYLPEKKIFIGYKARGGITGYAGSTGFTESLKAAKPFEEFEMFSAWISIDSYGPKMFWQTKHRLYEIDFQGHTVELLFEKDNSAIEMIQVKNWRNLKSPSRDTSSRSEIEYLPIIHIQTQNKKHYLVFREPVKVMEIDLPEEWGDLYSLLISSTATKAGVYVRHIWMESDSPPPDQEKDWQRFRQWYNKLNSKDQNQWVALYRIDEEANLNLINKFNWISPKRETGSPEYTSWKIMEGTRKMMVSTSPVLYNIIGSLFSKDHFRPRLSEGYLEILAEVLDVLKPTYISICAFLSIIMMVLVMMHGWARRTSWGKLISWIVFAGLFNVAGFLTYWALNHTTVIKCSVCGRQRGLERVDCVRCGAELPTPTPSGHELILSV